HLDLRTMKLNARISPKVPRGFAIDVRRPRRGAFCRLAHGPGAARADDNVKSRRQTRPCAPGARYTSDGHGTTAENGTCKLRMMLRITPQLRIRLGVDERRNERRDDRDDE